MTDERFRCRETVKKTGRRCQCPAAWGTELCRFHGGTAWVEVVDAGRRDLEKAVLEHLRWLGHSV